MKRSREDNEPEELLSSEVIIETKLPKSIELVDESNDDDKLQTQTDDTQSAATGDSTDSSCLTPKVSLQTTNYTSEDIKSETPSTPPATNTNQNQLPSRFILRSELLSKRLTGSSSCLPPPEVLTLHDGEFKDPFADLARRNTISTSFFQSQEEGSNEFPPLQSKNSSPIGTNLRMQEQEIIINDCISDEKKLFEHSGVQLSVFDVKNGKWLPMIPGKVGVFGPNTSASQNVSKKNKYRMTFRVIGTRRLHLNTLVLKETKYQSFMSKSAIFVAKNFIDESTDTDIVPYRLTFSDSASRNTFLFCINEIQKNLVETDHNSFSESTENKKTETQISESKMQQCIDKSNDAAVKDKASIIKDGLLNKQSETMDSKNSNAINSDSVNTDSDCLTPISNGTQADSTQEVSHDDEKEKKQEKLTSNSTCTPDAGKTDDDISSCNTISQSSTISVSAGLEIMPQTTDTSLEQDEENKNSSCFASQSLQIKEIKNPHTSKMHQGVDKATTNLPIIPTDSISENNRCTMPDNLNASEKPVTI